MAEMIRHVFTSQSAWNAVKLLVKKLLEAVPYGFAAAAVVAVVLIILKKTAKKDLTGKRIAVISVFAMYMSILIYGTIIGRTPGTYPRAIDLIPFDTGGGYPVLLVYAFCNLVLFIPFGFLFPACFRHKGKLFDTVFCGLLLSFLIESLQWLTFRGEWQLEDIILNLFGTIIGCVIYRASLRWRKKKEKLS